MKKKQQIKVIEDLLSIVERTEIQCSSIIQASNNMLEYLKIQLYLEEFHKCNN